MRASELRASELRSSSLESIPLDRFRGCPRSRLRSRPKSRRPREERGARSETRRADAASAADASDASDATDVRSFAANAPPPLPKEDRAGEGREGVARCCPRRAVHTTTHVRRAQRAHKRDALRKARRSKPANKDGPGTNTAREPTEPTARAWRREPRSRRGRDLAAPRPARMPTERERGGRADGTPTPTLIPTPTADSGSDDGGRRRRTTTTDDDDGRRRRTTLDDNDDNGAAEDAPACRGP